MVYCCYYKDLVFVFVINDLYLDICDENKNDFEECLDNFYLFVSEIFLIFL